MRESIDIADPTLRRAGQLGKLRGLRVFVVGGFVRDKLLGHPVTDIDLMVEGSGPDFARMLASDLNVAPPVVYEKFGTALLQHDNRKVEVVGARKEHYIRGSRNPSVEPGTVAEDLSRRDFTVNAMAAELDGGMTGGIIDPFDGRKDLEAKLLRTPVDPESTLDDDPLRMMRAARFASQLGFKVDRRLLEAIAKMCQRITIVSQERITDEIMKILASRRPSTGLQILFDTGLLKIVFPEVAELSGVDQRREYHHKDVFLHTLKVVDNISESTDNIWLRVAALFHDIAKPATKAFIEGTGWTFHGHEEMGARMVKGLFRRLRLPTDHLGYVAKLVRLHLRPMALVDEGVTDSAVRRLMFDAGPDLDDLMTLCRADITSKNPQLVDQVKKNYNLVLEKMKEVEERDRIRNWQPPLRGDEIMKVCSLEPGPLVGVLKDEITDAVLDGRIPNDHDAALAYLLAVKDRVIEAGVAGKIGKAPSP